MNWANDKRQEFIRESLYIYGFINRSHLIKKFRISQAAAANDLRKYLRTHPAAMIYDPRLKTYTAGRTKLNLKDNIFLRHGEQIIKLWGKLETEKKP